jgi:hypothetical protein
MGMTTSRGTGTSLDDITGYEIVRTDWTNGLPCTRTVVATVDGGNNYAQALELVKALRLTCTRTQYALIDNIYVGNRRYDDYRI